VAAGSERPTSAQGDAEAQADRRATAPRACLDVEPVDATVDRAFDRDVDAVDVVPVTAVVDELAMAAYVVISGSTEDRARTSGPVGPLASPEPSTQQDWLQAFDSIVPWEAEGVRVVIEGFDLPGRRFCDPEGNPLDDVRVGVQIRRDPHDLVPGDAARARWELDVSVVTASDGSWDFRGPAVHGKRGDRFLYLTWGNVDAFGHFQMFRRAKLMLDRIDPELVGEAERHRRTLVGAVRLTDSRGGPRCARVDPPDLEWSIERHTS
jgi:hypothetical protein